MIADQKACLCRFIVLQHQITGFSGLAYWGIGVVKCGYGMIDVGTLDVKILNPTQKGRIEREHFNQIDVQYINPLLTYSDDFH